ncbi:MAG: glycoside hydrolase family 88 protein, partial [Bacteroidota bacterium]
SVCLLSVLLMWMGACQMEEKRPKEVSKELLSNRLDILLEKSLQTYEQYPPSPQHIYRSRPGFWNLRKVEPSDWCSGFYAGILWKLHEYSQEESLKIAAKAYTQFLVGEAKKTDSHDIGFKIYSSYGNGYEQTGEESYKKILLQAVKSLSSRFQPKVRAIKSWDWNPGHYQVPVIIDNLMNLELLFEASRISGDSSYHKLARTHALTSLKHHFRPDFSSYHLVNFDSITGESLGKETNQGAADESAWARGQAWALYGMTMAFRYTQDTQFLSQAEGIANFFFSHPQLPKDFIPYWDFDAKEIPETTRDVSAACIAAAALLELATYSNQKDQYIYWADQVLLSLESSEYQADRLPFFLDHSTGNMPIGDEVNVPIVYADYYYVEALMRRLNSLTQASPS